MLARPTGEITNESSPFSGSDASAPCRDPIRIFRPEVNASNDDTAIDTEIREAGRSNRSPLADARIRSNGRLYAAVAAALACCIRIVRKIVGPREGGARLTSNPAISKECESRRVPRDSSSSDRFLETQPFSAARARPSVRKIGGSRTGHQREIDSIRRYGSNRGRCPTRRINEIKDAVP